jgi:hypothetical protein
LGSRHIKLTIHFQYSWSKAQALDQEASFKAEKLIEFNRIHYPLKSNKMDSYDQFLSSSPNSRTRILELQISRYTIVKYDRGKEFTTILF